MTLRTVSHCLLALLCVVAAEPSDPDCEALTKPLSLANPTAMTGSAKLLMSFTDSETFNAMMKVSEGSWFNMTAHDDHVEMSEDLKINGTCFRMSFNMTVESDAFSVSVMNVSSVYHLLPTCDGCFAISGNSTARNLKKTFKMMNIDIDVEDEAEARAVYFYGKDENMSDHDRFRKQAKCLGFTKEPVFQYDAAKGDCSKEESINVTG